MLTTAAIAMPIQTAANEARSEQTSEYKYAIEHVSHSNEVSTAASARAFHDPIRRIWFIGDLDW